MAVRNQLLTAAFVALCAQCCFAQEPCRANSVTYQINPSHSGEIAFKHGFALPLTRRWSRNLGGPVSYPLVANGAIFVTVGGHPPNGSLLMALSLKTGETLWEQLIAGPYNWSNAAYDRDKVFAVNFSGLMQAFSASNGKRVWSVSLPGQYAFTAAPTALDGRLFVGGAGVAGTLYAVDETNGAVEWTAFVQNGDISSPAVGDGGVYVSYPCQYYGFDATTGAQLWNDDLGCEGGGGSTPVFYRGRVYVRDAFGDFILDDHSGGLRGAFASETTPAFFRGAAGNALQLELFNGQLFCVDASSGKVNWSFGGDGQLASAPIIVNGLAFEGSQSGRLYALDANTGVKLWSTNVGAPITGLSEGGVSQPWTGLGAGQGMLVVPASNWLSVYAPTGAPR